MQEALASMSHHRTTSSGGGNCGRFVVWVMLQNKSVGEVISEGKILLSFSCEVNSKPEIANGETNRTSGMLRVWFAALFK